MDALVEKLPLRARQLPRDLEDRRRALLQRAQEPVGRLEIFADIGAVFRVTAVARGAAAGESAVTPVDGEPRQRLRVEGHRPAARCPPRMNVGRNRLQRRRLERRAGLGVHGADPAHALANALFVDAAPRRQTFQVAAGDEVEIVEKALHRRVELAAFGELQGETFAQVPRAHPDRFAGVQTLQSGFHPGPRAAEARGDAPDVAGEISGFVERVDEPGADQPFARVRHIDPDLLFEVTAQAFRALEIGFRPVAGVETALPAVDGRSVEPLFDIRRGSGVIRPGAFEERVAFERALDIGVKFGVREPQQMDRLLQARGHDHPLARTLRQPEPRRHGRAF